jgi:hypothetical protein
MGCGISRLSNASGWPGAFKTIALKAFPFLARVQISFYCGIGVQGNA